MIYENEAQVFYALAHPVRLEILELLRGGEACVCHIQAMLGQRQAYISQHLNVLRKAGLVSSRKDGQRVYYQDRLKLDAEVAAGGGIITAEMEDRNNALNARAIDLNQRKSRLGPFYYPMGTVKNVDIYW